MAGRRVIGAENIELARQRMQRHVEVMPGDIVTAPAREQAERLGIALLDGPVERPEAAKTDGATATTRGLWRRSPRFIPKTAVASGNPRRIRKLALVGAGGVGSNVAHLAANADMAETIALMDIAPGSAEATALDLNHASGVTGTRARVTGTTSLEDVEGAEIVVVTAGRPRGPGMTRADLIDTNRRVMEGTGTVIAERAPDAVVIVVTNPLDEMTHEMLRVTGFPRERVLGMAGTLDSSRFRNALAMAANVEVRDVTALTLGSHGEEMAPIVSQSTIKGRPVDAFLDKDQIESCVRDAVTGGGQVVALRKTGSAVIAPAHATIEVMDHMRGARLGAVPVSVMLDGEYGLEGVVLGVPCFLGAGGLVEVRELPLPDAEQAALTAAAEAIRGRLGLS